MLKAIGAVIVRILLPAIPWETVVDMITRRHDVPWEQVTARTWRNALRAAREHCGEDTVAEVETLAAKASTQARVLASWAESSALVLRGFGDTVDPSPASTTAVTGRVVQTAAEKVMSAWADRERTPEVARKVLQL